jgi:putative transposase
MNATKVSKKKKFKKTKTPPVKVIYKTYKQKLLLTHDQETLASRTAGCCRLLYNACLHQRSLAYQASKTSLGYAYQCLELTEAKEEIPWLNEPPSQPLQQSIKEVDTSMDRFFQGTSGYPHFRKKFQADSFTFPQGVKNIRRVGKKRGQVFLPKFKEVSFRWTQPLLGELVETTVVRDVEGWFICFVCAIPAEEVRQQLAEEEKKVSKTPVGIDRGIRKTIALSNGKSRNIPLQEFLKTEAKIACFQRKVAKKKKGSQNRRKLVIKIKKLHRRLFHLRNNWCHQVSYELAKNHSWIFMEALPLPQMVKSAKGTIENPGTNVAAKTGLNKSLLRQGLGKLKDYTLYKQQWRGQHLILVPAPYTSQTCYQCKYVNSENREGEDFQCLQCGWTLDADYNASLNILFDGLVKLLSLVLISSMSTCSLLAMAAGPAVTACGDARSQTRSMKQEPLSSKPDVQRLILGIPRL